MNEMSVPLRGGVSVSASIRSWQQDLLQMLLLVLLAFGGLALVVSALDAWSNEWLGLWLLYAVAYFFIGLVSLWQRVPYTARTITLLGVFYVLGIFELIEYGLSGDGALFLLPLPLLAAIFLGTRAGVLALVFVVLSQAGMAWAFASAYIVVPIEVQAISGDLSAWLLSALALCMIGAVMVVAPSYLAQRLIGALNQSNELVRELAQRVSVEQEQRHNLLQAKHEIEEHAALEQEQRQHLQRIIAQIHQAARDMSVAADDIMVAAAQQSAGAEEQIEAITHTINAVDEVESIAQQSVNRAQEVADTSQHSVEVSASGQVAVLHTMSGMEQIKTHVEGIAENILVLSEQTQQIGAIIATVSEIAAQSKMLALNASVEAARAGEHGKGFAVVAVEVRNLAEQSRQATAQVKAILSDIQRATNVTVLATQEGAKKVEKGGQLAAQAGDVIEQLAFTIGKSAQAAAQVAAGGQQQTSGVQQIAQAMRSINQATLQSLDSTRQVSQAAQNLNHLARELAEIVELQT